MDNKNKNLPSTVTSLTKVDTQTKDFNDERITEAEKRLNTVEERLPKLEERIQTSQVRYTEILGIFVALFTFVSLNVQIFSNVHSLLLAFSFVLLMGICMICFVFFLHLVLTSILEEKYRLWPYILFGLSLVIALLLISVILTRNETSNYYWVDNVSKLNK